MWKTSLKLEMYAKCLLFISNFVRSYVSFVIFMDVRILFLKAISLLIYFLLKGFILKNLNLQCIIFIIKLVLKNGKSLKHPKFSNRVEFFRNIFKMEKINQNLFLPLNGPNKSTIKMHTFKYFWASDYVWNLNSN